MHCNSFNKTSNISKRVLEHVSQFELYRYNQCYRGLDEYSSDEELAEFRLFVGYDDSLLIFAAACSVIFMIIGIPGNIITVISLSRYKKVRNATAIFIINLSISDILYSAIVFPISIGVFLNHSWTTGIFMCRLFPAVNYGLNGVSALTLVAITLNRYIMVCHPFHYHKLYRKKNLVMMIIAIWASAIIMLLPIILEVWGRFGMNAEVGFCTVIPDKNYNCPRNSLIVAGFVFPSFFIVTCYSRIFYFVKKSTKSSGQNIRSDIISRSEPQPEQPEISTRELSFSDSSPRLPTCEGNSDKSDVLTKLRKGLQVTFRRRKPSVRKPTKRDKKLQTMIIAVMISFFTCHMPPLVAGMVDRDFLCYPIGNITSFMLLYATTCSNPVIYVVMSKEYRQAYRNMFGCLKKR